MKTKTKKYRTGEETGLVKLFSIEMEHAKFGIKDLSTCIEMQAFNDIVDSIRHTIIVKFFHFVYDEIFAEIPILTYFGQDKFTPLFDTVAQCKK